MSARWFALSIAFAIAVAYLLSFRLLVETSAAQVASERRPVVLVHGFNATGSAWGPFLGPDGYLASAGLRGFAVGDGQVPGAMNTGNVLEPTRRTNSIAENAAILRDYIQGVKATTGAEQVDLVAHSMGGLISRYYIDRLMEGRDVAQLIMLGSPQRGAECANLPAAAGLYLPATLELRPSYINGVFNPQITHRRGVPFYILAGTAVDDPIRSPCAAVPSDTAISLESASGMAAPITEMPILHSDMNISGELFESYLKPLLMRPSSEIPTEPDPPVETSSSPTLQFTRVFTGHVAAGELMTHTIDIDEVDIASFSLYEPTRSLTVTVRGASGNLIELSPVTHGLQIIDDPSTLLYLGYGFNNPRPGPWRITLQATDQTPPDGATYALAAQYVGGARLEASSSTLVPVPGEPVGLTARLLLDDEPLVVDEAQALVRAPDGTVETVVLQADSDQYGTTWVPSDEGLYGIDVILRGSSPDGMPVERAAFLAVQVQPTVREATSRLTLSLTLALLALVAVVAGGWWLWRRRVRG